MLTITPDVAGTLEVMALSGDPESEDGAGRALVFTPSEALPSNTTFEVALAPGVATTDGVTLGMATDWTFTTGVAAREISNQVTFLSAAGRDRERVGHESGRIRPAPGERRAGADRRLRRGTRRRWHRDRGRSAAHLPATGRLGAPRHHRAGVGRLRSDVLARRPARRLRPSGRRHRCSAWGCGSGRSPVATRNGSTIPVDPATSPAHRRLAPLPTIAFAHRGMARTVPRSRTSTSPEASASSRSTRACSGTVALVAAGAPTWLPDGSALLVSGRESASLAPDIGSAGACR